MRQWERSGEVRRVPIDYCAYDQWYHKPTHIIMDEPEAMETEGQDRLGEVQGDVQAWVQGGQGQVGPH